MKQILITIAAVVLVGCGAQPNYSGVYTLDIVRLGSLVLELKPDSSFIGTPQGEEDDRGIGSWKVEGDLLVCEGTTEKSSKKIVLKLNKTTLELTSMTVDGEDRRPPVTEGADGNFFKKSDPSQKPPTAKAPDISIHEAALKGNIEAVKQHLAAGWDVNAKDEDGWTPLQHAVFSKEVVELLIANGADVNVQDNNGWTILHTPSDFLVPVAELLIEKGAKIDAKTNDGSTPLFNAILLGENKFARLLIEKGADV